MCFVVVPDSSLCQNGKQVEIITKMIFELCYIEAVIVSISRFSKLVDMNTRLLTYYIASPML